MATSFDNAEALWKIDRQGQRSKPVLERHKGKSGSIASFETTLPPKADAYHLQYGELRARIIDSRRTNAAAEHEIGLLVQEMRQWHGPLERDVPGFKLGSFTGSDVPDDTFRNVRALIGVVRFRQESGEPPLPYADALIAALEERLGLAEAAWLAAQQALAALQEKRRVVRELALELHNELVAFRRVLRVVLGSTHRDYQKLRAQRVQRGVIDEDDPPLVDDDILDDEEPASEPPTPAPTA